MKIVQDRIRCRDIFTINKSVEYILFTLAMWSLEYLTGEERAKY